MCWFGSNLLRCPRAVLCSLAASTTGHAFRRASTAGLYAIAARILCAELRLRKHTAKQAISEPSNCCLAKGPAVRHLKAAACPLRGASRYRAHLVNSIFSVPAHATSRFLQFRNVGCCGAVKWTTFNLSFDTASGRKGRVADQAANHKHRNATWFWDALA